MSNNTLNDMTETQKAYLAGIFDGDGCVSIVKSKKKYGTYHQLAVMFSQSSRPYLEKIRNIAGVGKIYEQTGAGNIKNTRAHYIWRIPSKMGADLLDTIAPYLIRKKAQAEIAHRFQETKAKRSGSEFRISDDLLSERESIYNELREWKHTGEIEELPC